MGTALGKSATKTPFFVATTAPLKKDDSDVFEAVTEWVFPVVLSWTYRQDLESALSGPGLDTRSHVACVRAAAGGPKNSASTDTGDGIGDAESGSRRSRIGTGWSEQWVLLVVVLVCTISMAL